MAGCENPTEMCVFCLFVYVCLFVHPSVRPSGCLDVFLYLFVSLSMYFHGSANKFEMFLVDYMWRYKYVKVRESSS